MCRQTGKLVKIEESSVSILRKVKGLFIEPKPVPFTAENFAVRDVYRAEYRILSAAILSHFEFDSVLDIGCANGFLLEDFHAAGKRISGIELSADALEFMPQTVRPNVTIGDFSRAHGRFDLVSCVEVAEHVAPSMSEPLVDALTRLSIGGIYFTAAPPGQPGHGHINCRPHTDWIEMFLSRRWVLDQKRTDSFRHAIRNIEKAKWLIENSLVFVPEGRSC